MKTMNMSKDSAEKGISLGQYKGICLWLPGILEDLEDPLWKN